MSEENKIEAYELNDFDVVDISNDNKMDLGMSNADPKNHADISESDKTKSMDEEDVASLRSKVAFGKIYATVEFF